MKKVCLLITLICVLFLLPGCRSNTPEITGDAGDHQADDIDYLTLDITKCESAVVVTATGCDAFNGLTGRVKGTDISGDIIKEVSTCADWESHFDGWYSIEGAGAKAARYTLRLEQKQKQEKITLGMNYYSLILDVTFFDAESVEIEHGSDITVNGLSGDFSFLVFVLGKNTDWLVGTAMTRIHGTLDQPGSLTLAYHGDSYAITSTVPIQGLVVEGSDGYADGESVPTINAATENNSYTLTFADGGYILK